VEWGEDPLQEKEGSPLRVTIHQVSRVPLPPLSLDASVAELVDRAKRNDRTAESILCIRFLPAVRTFARRRLKNNVDAVNEFVQDALVLFVEALRGGRIEDATRTGGFVLGICRNLAHDRAKQRERREALWMQYRADFEGGGGVTSVDAVESPTYETMHLEDCVSQLSARARDVLRFAFAESKTHHEIATLLEITEANARVLRHRTLEALRDCLSKRISWEEVTAQ